MITIEENPECQLYLFEILTDSINFAGKRKRCRKTHFKILNAVYLMHLNGQKKGHTTLYWCIQTIADAAKCSRRLACEFINSPDFAIFCDVKKDKWVSHTYKLKEWVFQWMRLFWRSGMMKNLHTKYEWWKSDFKKRIKKWLIPLVQEGLTVRQIYERLVNKLSTRKSLKVNATNPLKVATKMPPGVHEAFGIETNNGNPNVVLEEIGKVVKNLTETIGLGDADIRHFLFKNPIAFVSDASRRLSSWGLIEKPVQAMQYMINKIKKEKRLKYG